ncbi:hypothetical protein ACFWR4_38845 [Streptomyces hydrogenans]|uniref:hypothetical protein n=1 Tax=Streptomyces hydrogenans TaxID=1873719 RepID=UPI0036534716
MTGSIHLHTASGRSPRYGVSRPAALAERAAARNPAERAAALNPAERAARRLAFDPAGERARRVEAVVGRARAEFGPKAIVPGSPVA